MASAAAPEVGSRWDRLYQSARRWIVPGLGAGAVVAGAAVGLARPGGVDTYASIALAGGGAGSLLGWALRHHPSVARVEEDSEAPMRVLTERDVCPRCASSWESLFENPLPPPPPPSPSFHGTTVWGPVFSSFAHPGDELWEQWAPLDRGALPAALVGPVPETAYPEAPPNGPDPFGFRNAEVLFAGAAPPGPAGPDYNPLDFGGEAAGLGGLAGLSTSPTGIHWEMLNPTPPHLRPPAVSAPAVLGIPSSPPAIQAPPSARTAGSRLAPHPVCATCDRSLPDTRGWDPCTKCHRPVCASCLLESLWNHGQGYCQGCSQHHGLTCT
jgi:hypothetical protein